MVRVPPPPGASRLGPNIVGVGISPGGSPPGSVPGGGMTLDALLARQKLLQNQQVELPQMTSPMQGAGYLAQSVMQGLNQGRADKELAQGRQALAQAMTQFDPNTGEFSPEAIATMGALDPDKTFEALKSVAAARQQQRQRQEEHGWKTEEQQQQQTFQHGENEAQQRATAEQNELARRAEDARQRQQEAAAAGRQDDAQAAAQELAQLNAKLDAAKQEHWEPIDAPEGSKPGTMWVKSSISGEPRMVGGNSGVTVENKSESTWQSKQAESFAKQTSDAANEGLAARASLADLNQLEQLAADPNLPGGLQSKGLQYLRDKWGISLGEGADKTAAFTALVNKIAPSMRQPGSGPLSNQDMEQFLKSLPSLSNTPEGNKLILQSLRNLSEFKIATGELARQVSNLPLEQAHAAWDAGLTDLAAKMDPLKTVREATSGNGTGGGGGGDTPTFDPAIDREGDTANNGEWIVRGGKWVRAR
jgi:hypothetical protein